MEVTEGLELIWLGVSSKKPMEGPEGSMFCWDLMLMLGALLMMGSSLLLSSDSFGESMDEKVSRLSFMVNVSFGS